VARVDVNGIHLNVERAGSGPPLVLLHGFTGSVATWAPQIAVFARDFDTIAIDLLGHGASAVPTDPARYRMEQAVEDLITLLKRLGVGRAAWLGYSMGGRVALQVAVARPERVAALVLEGASAGIADAEARRARVCSDESLADFIEREGIAAFVDRWERLGLFANQTRLPADVRAALRRQRMANSPVGLANSLRGMGQGAQPPLHGRLAEVVAPILLVVGEEDKKFRNVAAEMAAMIPGVQLAVVAAAGHAAHLEQPDAFDGVVLDFLTSLDWSRKERERVR
jgi:2-succinyl-6-hydroxy-2,4-cyclohexadiene-1-carboxylate synthase